jgi:hypothetical protein
VGLAWARFRSAKPYIEPVKEGRRPIVVTTVRSGHGTGGGFRRTAFAVNCGHEVRLWRSQSPSTIHYLMVRSHKVATQPRTVVVRNTWTTDALASRPRATWWPASTSPVLTKAPSCWQRATDLLAAGCLRTRQGRLPVRMKITPVPAGVRSQSEVKAGPIDRGYCTCKCTCRCSCISGLSATRMAFWDTSGRRGQRVPHRRREGLCLSTGRWARLRWHESLGVAVASGCWSQRSSPQHGLRGLAAGCPQDWAGPFDDRATSVQCCRSQDARRS